MHARSLVHIKNEEVIDSFFSGGGGVDSDTGLEDLKGRIASWTWAAASPRLQYKQIRQSPDGSWLQQTADSGGGMEGEREREREGCAEAEEEEEEGG